MARTRILHFVLAVFLLAGLALPIAGGAAHANAGNAPDPEASEARAFVRSVADRGIAFLSDGALTQDEKSRQFRTLINDSFDMNTIARFALGRYWRQASAAQKKEYLELFRKMIVATYSDRFSDYSGQGFSIDGSREIGKRDILVSTSITPPQDAEDSQQISVGWRVRRQDDTYQIVDVIVEGVSMSVTHRSDFAAVIQRGGGNVRVLLDHLREKIDARDRFTPAAP